MRTTLDLDERVLDLARGRAKQRNITLGQAVSELALAGAGKVDPTISEDGAPLPIDPMTGLAYFPGVPGHSITPEQIADIIDEMDLEEARAVLDS